MLPIITQYWWALLLRGVISLAFGILALAFPRVTIAFAAIVFAAYLILDGVLAIVAGIRAAEAHRRWWPFLLEGLVSLVAGILAFAWPEVTVVVIIALVAVWAILSGLLMVVPAMRLPRGSGRGWLIFSGGVSVLLGLVILIQPAAGLFYIVLSIGIYAIIFGIGLIALGFQVRRLHASRLDVTV
jgi:uncharacterized membrane protein HdeD (DUF308 family)